MPQEKWLLENLEAAFVGRGAQVQALGENCENRFLPHAAQGQKACGPFPHSPRLAHVREEAGRDQRVDIRPLETQVAVGTWSSEAVP